MSLDYNLRKKRKSMSLSQEYVAEQLQVSRQAVSKWETGKSEPSMNNLKKLADLFSCDLNELISPEKDVEEEITLNTKKRTIYNIIGIILSFICFITGMLYAEQVPFLVIVGICRTYGYQLFFLSYYSGG
ncbi:MAG: helix-turn-helix transcriptional regulator [Alkalibacterium sp.]|nr:helix-turn-helix transcriptional regulator [Alkalibacterium sp.]